MGSAGLREALPGYEVDGEVGRGAWGVVYAGTHQKLGRRVAIKELPTVLVGDDEVRERFRVEARVLAGLNHPHIVPVYDFVDGDRCLLVMEFLSAGTLWDRFTTEGLGAATACGVVIGACAGLQFAHSQGVLHRDVKPENLMFGEDGTVKVTDFGIAQVTGGDRTLATLSGEVLGTPGYMAPEQAEGRPLSPATDVYAVGTVLYELLSGRLPFDEVSSGRALLLAKVTEAPRPLADVAPDLPGEIGEVVMAALAAEADDRPASTEELAVALTDACTEVWGGGWLDQEQTPILATGAMAAAVVRTTEAQPAVTPDEVRVPRRPRSGPTRVPTGPVGVADSPPGPDHDVHRTRPRADAAAPAIDLDRLDPDDVLGVDEVLEGPGPARPFFLAAAGALAAVLAVVLSLGGTDGEGPDTGGGTIALDGNRLPSDERIELDLSSPVPVRIEDVPGVVESDVAFDVLGLPLGTTSRGEVVDGAVDLEAATTRFLVAGPVSGEVRAFGADGRVVATRPARITPTHPWILTLPGVLTIVAVLGAVAYGEGYLRPLRRGRRRIGSLVGLAAVGGLGGLALSALSWMVLARVPSWAMVVSAVGLGAVAGLLLGIGSLRRGRRLRLENSSS